MSWRKRKSVAGCAILAVAGFLGACSVSGGGGESSVQSASTQRDLIGVPPDYPVASKGVAASSALDSTLSGDMRVRRSFGWGVLRRTSEPYRIKVDGANGPAVSRFPIPLWMTWYEPDEVQEILDIALKKAKGAGGGSSAPELTEADATNAMAEQVDEHRLRSLRRPTSSFQKQLVQNKSTTPITNEAEERRRQRGLTSTGFTLFSPSYVRHVVANYKDLVNCPVPGQTEKPNVFDIPAYVSDVHGRNFAGPCMKSEFPRDAVMAKAVWQNLNDPIPYFDTGPSGLEKIFADVSGAWDSVIIGKKKPSTGEILVQEDESGTQWGLVALHLSTKETRNWVWTTYWWAPDTDDQLANRDFGADRDSLLFGEENNKIQDPELRQMLNNYKMCVATDFEERGDLSAQYASSTGSTKSLADALLKSDEVMNRPPRSNGRELPELTGTKLFGEKAPRATWCSNPYVESHPGNSHTNCIGCHQHAGTGVAFSDTFYLDTPESEWHFFPLYGGTRVRGTKRADNAHTNVPNGGTYPTDFAWSIEFSMREIAASVMAQNGVR